MNKQDFDAHKETLLKDIRNVMDELEGLYKQGIDVGAEEVTEAKAKLQEKLEMAKEKLSIFEEEANERVAHHTEHAKERFNKFEEEFGERLKQGKERFNQSEAGERFKHRAKQADNNVREKPYYAMGFAALAGLVIGMLMKRR